MKNPDVHVCLCITYMCKHIIMSTLNVRVCMNSYVYVVYVYVCMNACSLLSFFLHYVKECTTHVVQCIYGKGLYSGVKRSTTHSSPLLRDSMDQ